MSHSLESIDAFIREGTSLKNKIGMIARNLEQDAVEGKEACQLLPEKEVSATESNFNNISLITPLSGGLENTIKDIFSMICRFDGIDHCGIYIFNRGQRQFYMACHYNIPEEFLARVIKLNSDSWQVNIVRKGHADFNAIQGSPLHVNIAYEQHGIHSVALIPLIHKGHIVGYMHLASQKEDFVNDFERQVLEWLTLRISRTVALHLAMVRLSKSNDQLTGLMPKLRERFDRIIQPSDPEPISGLLAGMKHEIDGLFKSLSQATEKITQKMKEGQRRRELPFLQKKVDAMLHDIDLIVQIIDRLQVFCNIQPPTLVRGMIPDAVSGDAVFLHSMSDFYEALNILVQEEKNHEPVNTAFSEGHFKPLSRPVQLADLKFRINRLTPN